MRHHAPSPWIDTLFARLITTWGRDFLAQYEGVDIDVVKADWSERLHGFVQMVEGEPVSRAIDYALDILPERPVNALQFRKLCQGYTPTPRRALPGPEPKAPPDLVRAAFARLHEPNPEPEDLRWARRYVETWGNQPKLQERRMQHLKRAIAILARHEERLKREALKREETPA